MTATSFAKAGPTEERVEGFDLRDAGARRFRDLRRGMKFPEVRMKDLLYGEKEGLTSGGGKCEGPKCRRPAEGGAATGQGGLRGIKPGASSAEGRRRRPAKQ